MSFYIAVGGVAVVAFLLAYLRAGRFGATALALGIGYLLTFLWIDDLAGLRLVEVPYLSWRDASYAFVVLLPGLLALLFSPKKKSILPKIIASPLIVLLVVTVLLPIIGAGSQGNFVYDNLNYYRNAIITGVLVLGLFDAFFARLPKAPRRSRSND